MTPLFRPNRIQPTAAGILPAGQVVFDGGSGLTANGQTFTPRTLYLGVQGPIQGATRQVGTIDAGVLVTGWVDFELSGLRLGMPYTRRFSLYAFEQVRIPLTFEGASLRIVAQSAPMRGFAVAATLTDEEVSGGSESSPTLWYATEDSGAGTFRVPAGAVELVPEGADPAFAWVAFGDVDKTITIPSPAFAGVPQPVIGSLYSHGGAFRAAWKVRF